MQMNLYSPLSGAKAQERVMEIIANNLANMNTVGFKAESVTFKLLEPEPEKNYIEPLPPANYKIPFETMMPFHGNDMSYVGISGVNRDTSQGPVITTRNPLDVMIEGDGYLSVMTREGVRYTRNGSLTLNEQGAIVDKFGNPVLGEKGNIFVRPNDLVINDQGEVYQKGELVDRMLVFSFKDAQELEQVGMNHFIHVGTDAGRSRVEFPTLRQGFLEGSNVNAIKNLTQMIIAHRSYEAYQKAIKNYDSMMDKSANTIGLVRS